SPPLPECRDGWALPVRDRTLRSAAGGLGLPLQACQTNPAPAAPGGRGVVAVQPRCLSSSFSGPVPGDRSRDAPSISTYAPLGAISGPVWRDQSGHDASVSGAS